MNAFTVTAVNGAYFQTLVTLAHSSVEAAEKFHRYLTTPVALAAEINEWEMSEQVGAQRDREFFRYGFDDFDIAAFDGDPRWLGTPTTDVQLIRSNGNG